MRQWFYTHGGQHQEISGFGWYIDAWKQYGVAQGRSCRKAYWMFYLFDTIFTIVASIADTMLFDAAFGDWGPLCIIYTFATITPFITVSVRRMHDTGHSGWWILVPIVNLVFLCTDSQPGENKYGPTPKTAAAVDDSAAMRMILPVGRSGWAIASGYLGLFSLLLVFAPIALLTGILAVADIRKHSDKHGMGRAIFGIVMGALGTIGLIAVIVASLG